MVLQINEAGLQLESSPKATAGLPMQAFAINLSDSVLEGMIACVQNGQEIKLALGNTPVSTDPTTANPGPGFLAYSLLSPAAPVHLHRELKSSLPPDPGWNPPLTCQQTLVYGSSTHQLPRNADFQPYDLYMTDPSESSRVAERLPNPAQSLFKKPELTNTFGNERARAGASPPAGRKAETGLDADIAALQSSLAQASADKKENS